MDQSSEVLWPQHYPELMRIEDLLKCGICYEYMETTVMTPCSHNYCSLCIRKYLHYKTQCPSCFQRTFETDLHTNRVLDEIILQFSKVRIKLVNKISTMTTDKVVTKNDNVDKKQEILPLIPVKSAPVKENCPTTSKSVDVENSKSPRTLIGFFSPSCSSKGKYSTPKKTNHVPCPVCKVEILQIHINKHLDECLKRQSMPATTSKITTKRKPLPKLVFNLMKDAELKKKMKEHGLLVQGDRKTLENRFQRFCTLYNAECDKTTPRSAKELLKLCQDEENAEKKMQKLDVTLKGIVKVSRNAEQNVIDQANRTYLEMHASSYDSLIKNIKSHQADDKSSVKSLHTVEAAKVDAPPCTTSQCEFVENSLKTNDSVIDIFNQSTDNSSSSDEICELIEGKGKLMEIQGRNKFTERLTENKLVEIVGQDFIDSSSNSSSFDIDECITRPSNIPAINNDDNDHQVSLLNESRPTRKRTCPSRFGSNL